MLKKYMWVCAVCLCLLAVLAGPNVWAHSFTQVELAYMPAEVPADMDIDDTAKPVINGKRMEGDSMRGILSHIFSLLNTYPVVNVPVALSSTNVPIGVQVVGNTFDDLEAFRVAAQLSKVMPKLYTGKLMPDFRNMK